LPYSPSCLEVDVFSKFIYADRAQSTPIGIRMAFRLPGSWRGNVFNGVAN
jgi:hypothetical protein